MAGPGTDRRHVLVVDRDIIVGMSVAQDLDEMGFRVSGPFMHADEALTVLAADPPDLAILDVDLRDGTGMPLARALRERAVPFVCFSANRAQRSAFGDLGPVLWVDKPGTTGDILAALDGATSPRPAAEGRAD